MHDRCNTRPTGAIYGVERIGLPSQILASLKKDEKGQILTLLVDTKTSTS